MKKRIRGLSGDLVEVKGHESHEKTQFIHQSVKNYLVQSGFQSFKGFLTNSVIGRAHFQLSRSCIKYIAMKEVREISKKYAELSGPGLESKLPFLRYAITARVSHAEIVEEEEIPQGDF